MRSGPGGLAGSDALGSSAAIVGSASSAKSDEPRKAVSARRCCMVVLVVKEGKMAAKMQPRVRLGKSPASWTCSVPAFAALLLLELLVSLLRAIELLRCAHGLAAIAQQLHQAAGQD